MRRGGRDRLEQPVILRQRRVLEHHRPHALPQLRRHLPQKAQRARARRAIPACRRVIARIHEHDAEHRFSALVRDRQCERARLAREHRLARQRGHALRHTHGAVRRRSGRVDAAVELAVELVELRIAQPALKIMVAVRDRPRHTRVDEWLHALPDRRAHQLPCVREREFAPLGERRRLPVALAIRLRIGGVIPGDLIAREDHEVGPRGLDRRGDQADRVF